MKLSVAIACEVMGRLRDAADYLDRRFYRCRMWTGEGYSATRCWRFRGHDGKCRCDIDEGPWRERDWNGR